MNNLHSTCSHADNICFDVVNEEEFARLSEIAKANTDALADFDREFGIA